MSGSMVTYNGIDLELTRITRWETHPVYDESGADFLYYHTRLAVQTVYNPKATVSTPNARAAVTAEALQEMLNTPRRPLVITVGTNVVLASPLIDPSRNQYFAVDAKNGPQPIGVHVLAIHGVKSMIVLFEVETWWNPCLDFTGATLLTSPILSHRWELEHDIDELDYTRRVITGRAIFRTDLMLDNPDGVRRVPDDYRKQLFHPVPNNFQRESIRVVANPEGTALAYTVVDQEKPLNLGFDTHIKRIEGVWRSGYKDSGILELMAKYYVTLTIRVWGRRKSPRQQLINAAISAAASFKFADPRAAPRLYYQADLTVDVFAKFVELTIGSYQPCPGAVAVGAIGDSPDDLAGRISSNFPESLGDLARAEGQPGNTGLNPPPPNGNGTRGYALARMIAQTLSEPCTVPDGIPGVAVTGVYTPPAVVDRAFS